MTDILSLKQELEICRKELKNIRQEIMKLKKIQEKDFEKILTQQPVTEFNRKSNLKASSTDHNIFNDGTYTMRPIGYLESWFKSKNGTPRQSVICPSSKAILRISKNNFSNPSHAIADLLDFSHIWLIFVFHKNSNIEKEQFTKAKVKPPRLNGCNVGVFATRSPYRPNPIGLTLSKLDKIEDDVLYLSGVDLLDGTPVLDIKPYIPSYDTPAMIQYKFGTDSELNFKSNIDQQRKQNPDFIVDEVCLHSSGTKLNSHQQFKENNESKLRAIELSNIFKDDMHLSEQETVEQGCTWKVKKTSRNELEDSTSDDLSKEEISTVPVWLTDKFECNIILTVRAEKELEKFHCRNTHIDKCKFCLEYLSGPQEASQAIKSILESDPRSVYRKQKCTDKVYYLTVDTMHITSWFDEHLPLVQVLRIMPLRDSPLHRE